MTRAAVILDVDGTLVDSNDAHARAWVDAFSDFGVAVAYEPIRRAVGMGGDKLMPHVSGIEETSELGEQIAAKRKEIFKTRYLPHLQGFPRTRDLIERFLADGLVLAIASSAKEEELNPLLEKAGVADLIAKRTSSDDADNSKPDPDIVVAALQTTKVDAGRAVMIGDTPYDVTAAKRAGVEVIGFESGGWSREALAGAIEVYAGPSDLLDRYDRSVIAGFARPA